MFRLFRKTSADGHLVTAASFLCPLCVDVLTVLLYPFCKIQFSVHLGVSGKHTTSENSAMTSPKTSTKGKCKHRCEAAVCSVGIMAAVVALGADLGKCAKDLRPELMRLSSKSDKHKSPNSRRRNEVGGNRRSWFGSSFSTDDSVFSANHSPSTTSPRADQDITGFGPNKRPLSTPVLLKATFYRGESQRPTTFVEPNCNRRRSSSTLSPDSPDPLDQELIDLRSERRDRRARSVDSSELRRINISTDSLTSSSDNLSTNTVVNCNRYSQGLTDLDIYKLPPPPFSPRGASSPRGTSSPRPDCNAMELSPTKFNFPVGEPIGAARPRPRPWQDSLSPSPSSSDQSPTSEQDKLTLLDVHMEGESHDKTQPLLKAETVLKMPTFEELQKEFVGS